MKQIISVAMITFISASNHTASAQVAGTPGPHLIVYKTKGNYNNLVPVLLSDDKQSIIGYPAPQDIRSGGKSIMPTRLRKGYLIDNRGINEHVAFIDMTYEEYAKLNEAPTVDKMYTMIKDKDPLVSLCDCGLKSSFKNPKSKINHLICRKRLFKKCKAIVQKKD